jgi:hypothetical protein
MYYLVFHEALCRAFAAEKFTEHQLLQSGTPFLPSPVLELEFSPAEPYWPVPYLMTVHISKIRNSWSCLTKSLAMTQK